MTVSAPENIPWWRVDWKKRINFPGVDSSEFGICFHRAIFNKGRKGRLVSYSTITGDICWTRNRRSSLNPRRPTDHKRTKEHKQLLSTGTVFGRKLINAHFLKWA